MSENENKKEYWSTRVLIKSKDELYEIADELRWEIGKAFNECLACGLKHKDEWAKGDKKNN